jgi:cytochrome b6-f complex iron-sulfur subunit
MERKDFVKFIAGAAVTGSVISILDACKKDDNADTSAGAKDFTVDLSASANAALLNPGGSLVSNSVMIINNNGTYVALSDICTHQRCSLTYNSSSSRLNCPCHGSAFSISGSVINGPASSSLKKYNVAQNGSVLHVTG